MGLTSAYGDKQLKRLWDSVTQLLRTPWRWVLWRIHLVYWAYKIPGPPALPFVGSALEFLPFYRGVILDFFKKASRKYGNVIGIYLGPKYLVALMSPEDLEILLSGNKYLEKGLEQEVIKSIMGNTLLISPVEKWHPLRKALNLAFNTRVLEQFLPVFHSCGDEFQRQLRMRAGTGCVDVYRLSKLLALDVICETVLGIQINAQVDGSSPFHDAVDDITQLATLRELLPWLWTDFVFSRTSNGRRYKECKNIILNTSSQGIRERRAELEAFSGGQALGEEETGQQHKVCLVDHLFHAASDNNLTDDDICNEVILFLIAGHDSSATTIALCLFLLARHQDVQDKVLQELQSVFSVENYIRPSLQDLSKLKYLEMVIKETLRLYPPLSIVGRNIPDDLRLRSQQLTLPAGSAVLLVFWFLHRNPEVFPDPEKFDPERFSPEASKDRHPYAYLPFSAGPRNCIGLRYAILELKILLAQTIWNFRVLPDIDHEPKVVWEGLLKVVNGVSVRFEKRQMK